MQFNTITGNIARITVKTEAGSWENVSEIKGDENGTFVFISVADHYWDKKNQEERTRFIPMGGFVPANLTISVGMLVQASYEIQTFKNEDNNTSVSLKFDYLDVSLRSKNRESEVEAEVQVETEAEVEAEVETEVEVQKSKAKTKAKTRAKATVA